MKPPEVKDSFDDCDVMTQSKLIAYNQIRNHEEMERDTAFMKAIARSS